MQAYRETFTYSQTPLRCPVGQRVYLLPRFPENPAVSDEVARTSDVSAGPTLEKGNGKCGNFLIISFD